MSGGIGHGPASQLDRIEAKLDMLALAVTRLIDALADEDDEPKLDLNGEPLPRSRDPHQPL